MKHIMALPVILLTSTFGFNTVVYAENNTRHTSVMTAEKREAKSPQQVLERLKQGNQRFVDGKLKNRDYLAQANKSTAGQHPVAVILNCLDSRTPPEIVFDQGIGDVFVARIAGNILNDDILGSMEFGTKLMGAKVIAVIGHTNCGAMRGACQHAELGHLTNLLQKIEPAVKLASKELDTNNCNKADFIDQIAKDNVLHVIQQISASSPVLNQLVQDKELIIVGGIQDLSTGKVTFF